MSRILKNPICCIANNDSIEYFKNQGFEVHNKELADKKIIELLFTTIKENQRNSIQPARAGTGKSLLAWLVKCGKSMTYYTYSHGKRYNYYKCRAWQEQEKTIYEDNSQ